MTWIVVGVAVGYYVTAITAVKGFRGQQKLVSARRPERFADQLAHIGGVGRARAGVVVDLGFVAVAAATAVVWLTDHDARELVVIPLVAAVVDTSEDLVLLASLRDPTMSLLTLLARLSYVKLACWAATLAVCVGAAF